MQLIVILLVSVIGQSLGDILHIKCGDETCESAWNSRNQNYVKFSLI